MSETGGGDADLVSCRNCGNILDDWGVFVVYGEFDRERQGFERGDHSWHLCMDCWNAEYDAKKATQYQTEDADELWSILDASNGNLVADLSTFFIPGPCYARVVDNELEVCTVDQNPHREDGQITFDPEPTLVDEHDLFLEGLLEDNTDPEYPVYLVTREETPFARL